MTLLVLCTWASLYYTLCIHLIVGVTPTDLPTDLSTDLPTTETRMCSRYVILFVNKDSKILSTVMLVCVWQSCIILRCV